MSIQIDRGARSSFVTRLAWLSLFASAIPMLGALGELSTLLALGGSLRRSDTNAVQSMGPIGLVLDHFGLSIAVLALVWTTTFISSIGLLRRQNWARVLYVALLIALIVGVAALSVAEFLYFRKIGGDVFTPNGARAVAALQIAALAFSILIILMLISIVKRLSSEAVKNEFDRRAA